jgi:hypothetical protein
MNKMILGLAFSMIPFSVMAKDLRSCELNESNISIEDKLLTKLDCEKITESRFSWSARYNCGQAAANKPLTFDVAIKNLNDMQYAFNREGMNPAVAKLKQYIDENMEAYKKYTKLKKSALSDLDYAFSNMKALIQDTNVVENCGDDGLVFCNAMMLSGPNEYRSRSMSDPEPVPKYRLDRAGKEKLLGKVLKHFSPEGLKPEKLQIYNTVKEAHESAVENKPLYDDYKDCFEEFEKNTVQLMLKQVYAEIIESI